MTSEQKVGALFLLGIGLLLGFTLFVTDLGGSGSEFAISFPRVSKLKRGDMVTYNGVRIGQVNEVRAILDGEGRPAVQVIFRVDSGQRRNMLVGPGTVFRIREGMLGGSHLEIAATGGRPLETQEDLNGLSGRAPEGLDDAVASLRGMIDENRTEVQAAIVAMKTGLTNFGEMSGEVRDVVKANREAIGSAVTNVAAMSGAIRDLVDENAESLKLAIARASTALEQLNGMLTENREGVKSAVLHIGGAAAVIEASVGENREDLRTVINSLAQVSPRLDAISADMEVITGQIASGKGTIGKLVMEDTLHTKAVTAVDGFNQRLEEVKPVTSGISQLRLYGSVEGGMNTESGVQWAGAFLRLEPRPWKFYQAGVTFQWAPEDVWPADEDPDELGLDFTLVFGWRFLRDDDEQRYRVTVAAGLVDTEFGGWITAPVWGDWLHAKVLARAGHDDREPDDRRYEDSAVMVRATLEATVWERITLIGGVDDCADEPAPWIGLRGEILDNDLRNLVTLGGIAP